MVAVPVVVVAGPVAGPGAEDPSEHGRERMSRMTPQECTDGRPRRSRARDGRGGGRGAGRGGGEGRGRGTSVARGAAASVAAFVAKDVLDPDGLLRPVLRGAAERLQNSPSRLLCRAGARYLELDPHPLDVIEPVSSGVPQGGRPGPDRVSLPSYAGEAAESHEVTDADAVTDAGADADAGANTDADAVPDAGPGTPRAEGREAPPA